MASEVNLDIHPVKKGCSNAGEYAFFCNYVVNNILQDESYGATDIQRNAMLQRGGLKIYTSLNTEAQKVAKQSVESTQPGATNTNDINTALTSIE
ncbi:MAG: penicillin-binding protein, partial [Rothia sp. (in: high G+C Gram-positive bacteria)]|nr:penicillin-binding protein [Rothia sp. (in: high G+C Gram-positive bacteria)]